MLKRLVAVLTTLVLAVGLTVGVSTAASAHTPTQTVSCTGLTLKFKSYGPGTTNYYTLTVDDVVVADRIPFGDNHTTSEFPMTAGAAHSWKLEIDAQHNSEDKLGARAITDTWVPCASTDLTCDVATLYKGSPLVDGEQIDIKVSHNGGPVQTLTGKIETRQSYDPVSESGLVIRLKLESGDTTLPLTNAQKASGIFSVAYSSGWTGTWQVQWVQYNNKYFNQDYKAEKYKNCQRDIPVTIAAVPTSQDPTCSVDGKLVLPAPPTGVTWKGGANGDGPGIYTIVAEVAPGYTLNGAPDSWVIQVLPKGTGLSCGPPPCIASNQVTYTYDPTTNSGTVTVPNPAGSSGKLCDGFWVTAVAWKYQGNAVWPQSLDKSNPMPENGGSFYVDEPGTYSYGAEVECGQGDIYASYHQQPVPTAVLNGPNDPYAEHFLHQMGFRGPTPTYHQDTPGCNRATPVQPTMTPITECGRDGALSYGPTTGVVYTLTAGNGKSGAWEVTATPAPNYYFSGSQVVTYSGDLGTRTDCTQAAQPEFETAQCNTVTGVVTGAYVIIPTTTPNVAYRVDGTLYDAGTRVDLGIGAHVVTAEAKPGYTLTGQSTFPLNVTSAEPCDDPVEYVKPIITDEICDKPTGDILGASIEFTDVEYLTYYLDGAEIVFAAGETVKKVGVSAGPHTITVKTDDGYYLAGTALLTELDDPITIATPDACDDPVKYVEPDVVDEVCDVVDGGVADGVVTFDLADLEHLTYVFDGTVVDAANLVFERPKGDYSLVVTADPGYYITGGGATETYTISIGDPGTDCDELTVIPTDPYGSPEECVPDSPTGEKTDGTITIVRAENVTWQISNDADGIKHPVDTSGPGALYVFSYPAGDYTVWATPAPGYLVTKASFPVTIEEPDFPCSLVTFPDPLPTGASWTHQVCSPGGLVAPTITIEPIAGVTYFIDGAAVTSTTTTVAVGQHKVTAVPDDPANTVTTAEWNPLLLAAPSALCGDLTTLALTGGSVNGWLIVAFLLVQAGLVLVAIRFVTIRRERARHLA